MKRGIFQQDIDPKRHTDAAKRPPKAERKRDILFPIGQSHRDARGLRSKVSCNREQSKNRQEHAFEQKQAEICPM